MASKNDAACFIWAIHCRRRRCDQGRTVLPHTGMFPNGPGIASTEAALHRGYEAGLSYYLGKMLQCASFCADPIAGRKSYWARSPTAARQAVAKCWRLEQRLLNAGLYQATTTTSNGSRVAASDSGARFDVILTSRGASSGKTDYVDGYGL